MTRAAVSDCFIFTSVSVRGLNPPPVPPLPESQCCHGDSVVKIFYYCFFFFFFCILCPINERL